jgi:hypothetical protein
MRFGVAFLCAICAFLTVPAFGRELKIPWQNYQNPRFGTQAVLPKSWVFKRDINDGEGAMFTSPNGQADAVILASRAQPDDARTFQSADKGERVTYRFRKGNVIVMSGYKGDLIFYRKHVLGCSGRIWNHLLVTYPVNAKKLFDPVLHKMVFSLKAGRDSNCQG